MKILLTFLLSFLTAAFVEAQQKPTGFYLTVKCTRDLKKHTSILGGKNLCLTNEPVLRIHAFESITDLHESKELNLIFFDVIVTDKDFKVLQNLLAVIAETNVALVVDNKLVFLIDDVNADIIFRSFRVIGTYNHKGLRQIYFTLKNQILASKDSVVPK